MFMCKDLQKVAGNGLKKEARKTINVKANSDYYYKASARTIETGGRGGTPTTGVLGA